MSLVRKTDPRRITARLRRLSDAHRVAVDTGARLLDAIQELGYAQYLVPDGEDGPALLARVRAHGSVAAADFDHYEKPPKYGTTTAWTGGAGTYVDKVWHLKRMNVYRAWKLLGNRGSPTVKVGMFDGFEIGNHANIARRLSIETPNGSPMNGDTSHGDAVANDLAGDGTLGSWGVAPGVDFTYSPSNADSDFAFASQITALADAGCRIMSQSTMTHDLPASGTSTDPGKQAVIDAAEYAWGLGTVIFEAAANDGWYWDDATNYSPANLPHCVGVGALQEDDVRWKNSATDGSNYGPKVNLVAPGRNRASHQSVSGVGDKWISFGHTSDATPHAAGVAALVLSAYPGLTKQQLIDVLWETGDSSLNTRGTETFAAEFPNARIPNAGKAVALALSMDPANAGSVFIAPSFWKAPQIYTPRSEISWGDPALGFPNAYVLGHWNDPSSWSIGDGPFALQTANTDGTVTTRLSGNVQIDLSAYSGGEAVSSVELWLGSQRLYLGAPGILPATATYNGGAGVPLRVVATDADGNATDETYTDVLVTTLSLSLPLTVVADPVNPVDDTVRVSGSKASGATVAVVWGA